jgi:hypothetical protein
MAQYEDPKQLLQTPKSLVECVKDVGRRLDNMDRDAQIYVYQKLFQQIEKADKSCILSALLLALGL